MRTPLYIDFVYLLYFIVFVHLIEILNKDYSHLELQIVRAILCLIHHYHHYYYITIILYFNKTL